MPRRRLNSYLRTHRLKAALSQPELGELLGLTKSAISNYETEHRPVSVKVLVASEIIFGVPASDLFPALYAQVEEDLAIRAHKLFKRLEGREDRASKKKHAALAAIPDRMRAHKV